MFIKAYLKLYEAEFVQKLQHYTIFAVCFQTTEHTTKNIHY